MTALMKFFRSGSGSPKSTDLDSRLLADLGLSRLVMEYAHTDHSSAVSSQQGEQSSPSLQQYL